MPAHDVSLPHEQAPVFPRHCVSCGEDKETQPLQISEREAGFYSHVLPFLYKRIAVEVPVCAECWDRVRSTRRRRFFISRLLPWVSVVLVIVIFGFPALAVSKWVLVAVCLVVLVPWCAWEYYKPQTFDLLVTPHSVIYEFKDKTYAEYFAHLNGAQVD